MARAIALVRNAPVDIAPILRATIVTGCALALILAGPGFPL